MIKFEIDLIGGPLDGGHAIVEVDTDDESIKRDGPLDLDGHIYQVTFSDMIARYEGKQ